MFDITFTGTRTGMTKEQTSSLFRHLSHLLKKKGGIHFHHGGCRGADRQAHGVATMVSIPITVHPGDTSQSVFFQDRACKVEAVQPYLERNWNMVKTATLVIACPSSYLEELRSGTWATIRYARKQKKELWIILPDGTTAKERR